MVSVNVHNAHPASACAIRWMKWCVHNTVHTHILICSRYLSRRESEIFQNRTCHLKAVWTFMDNLILCFFFHWNSLPSWTELQKEPSNRLILCWGRHFTWKQHLGNTFLWEAPFQMPGDSLSWKISGVSAFQLFQEFEVFPVVSQRDTAKWGHPQTLRIWKC